jgi:CheY-like chemotaxis protein
MIQPKLLSDINLQGKKILVVEDDFISGQFIKELFDGTHVEIVHVLTASSAIELLQNNIKFDLVLLDIQLPDMNGLQVAKSIKTKRPNLPIVVQTAYAFDSYKQRSIEIGCDYFISKPIDIAKLYDIIKKIFKK